jgi:xylulokinase
MAVTGGSAGEVCTRPAVLEVIEPDSALTERLAAKLACFRAAYPALRSLYQGT